jgi:hypothetical protein
VSAGFSGKGIVYLGRQAKLGERYQAGTVRLIVSEKRVARNPVHGD